MDDLLLNQIEADALLAMDKIHTEQQTYWYPEQGRKLSIPLMSRDRRASFLLDINKASIIVSNCTYQNRFRTSIILVRLDIGGPPHRNPNGEEIATPHIHLFREGFHDKWAFPVPSENFRDITNHWIAFEDFMNFCNVVIQPTVRRRVFI
jgi:hypothetical protein